MNNSPEPAIAITAATLPPSRLKKHFGLWILLGLLLTLCAARVEAQDDDYLAIYNVIDQADALNAGGQTAEARNKYIEAKHALMDFQQNNPNWNTPTVNFRLKYLDQKIAATTVSATASAVEPAAATTTAASPAAPQNAMAGAAPSVKLLEAGSEPRKVLSLHPAVGDKQNVSLTSKISVVVAMAGSQMPAMDMPAMQMTMTLEVKSVSPDGEITYGMVFSAANVADVTNATPGMAAAMQSALAGMQGMTATGKMSSKGIIRTFDVKLPDGASPQLSQAMAQIKDSFSSSSTVLPAEAVGPGAKWEYQTQVKSQGITIDQTVDYQLVSVSGDQLTLQSTIRQNAANQKIESPAMPGMKVDLTKMTGTGSGNSTFDLGHIMPLVATVDEDVEMVMGINMGQQPQSMDTKMKINLTFGSK